MGDDRELVSKCIKGSREAWEAVYRRASPLVRGILGAKTWGFSQHDVDDLEQEVFVKLFRDISKYDDRYSLESFVAMKAKGIALDRRRLLRAVKRGSGREPDSLDDPAKEHLTRVVAGDEGNPARWVQLRELISAALQELRDFRDECRHAIVMFYFEGLTYREMAPRLGLRGEGSVAARLSRCLLELRARVEARYGSEAAELVVECF